MSAIDLLFLGPVIFAVLYRAGDGHQPQDRQGNRLTIPLSVVLPADQIIE